MPIVSGFHPETGEEIFIKFSGNFPFKDPDTNIFIFEKSEDGQMKPKFAGRDRTRFEVLSAQGEEILDSRPMAAAVMFDDHIPPEQKIADLMRDANFRAYFRALLAEDRGVDTYDEFDIDDQFEDLLKDRTDFDSPYEQAFDEQAGRSIPRALHGMFQTVKQVVQKGTGPLGTPPANDSVPPSPAEQEPSGDGSTGSV